MSFLVFVSHDFELGRTWLAEGVDRHSRTRLFVKKYIFIVILSFVSSHEGRCNGRSGIKAEVCRNDRLHMLFKCNLAASGVVMGMKQYT